MCKFTKPQIPADATADERRAIMFNAMSTLDLNDKVEKRDNLTYLSWASAWAEFKSAYPSATYKVVKNPVTGLPYFSDPQTGILVFTEVTVDNVTHEMWLPVMNSANKAMRLEPYSYQVYDKFKKQTIEKTVEAATTFDINKAIMRCLVKNLAMFGLGLYIYSGEDVPEKTTEESAPAPTTQQRNYSSAPSPSRQQRQPQDRFAAIKGAINSSCDLAALMSLYLDHQNEIESNPEIKALLTQRKQQIQLINS